jgi:hypothetical protein
LKLFFLFERDLLKDGFSRKGVALLFLVSAVVSCHLNLKSTEFVSFVTPGLDLFRSEQGLV